MATFTAWLASQGASLLLGFLANVILSALQAWQADKTTSDLGRVTAERDQARVGLEVKDAELDALASAPADAGTAIARLEEGSA